MLILLEETNRLLEVFDSCRVASYLLTIRCMDGGRDAVYFRG